jgi:hypothetical protein
MTGKIFAKATIGGDWQKFTDWASNTLIPLRSAEKEVAAFWSTLADESKSAILMVFLALLGRHLPRWLFQLLQLYGLSLRLVLLYG